MLCFGLGSYSSWRSECTVIFLINFLGAGLFFLQMLCLFQYLCLFCFSVWPPILAKLVCGYHVGSTPNRSIVWSSCTIFCLMWTMCLLGHWKPIISLPIRYEQLKQSTKYCVSLWMLFSEDAGKCRLLQILKKGLLFDLKFVPATTATTKRSKHCLCEVILFFF